MPAATDAVSYGGGGRGAWAAKYSGRSGCCIRPQRRFRGWLVPPLSRWLRTLVCGTSASCNHSLWQWLGRCCWAQPARCSCPIKQQDLTNTGRAAANPSCLDSFTRFCLSLSPQLPFLICYQKQRLAGLFHPFSLLLLSLVCHDAEISVAARPHEAVSRRIVF